MTDSPARPQTCPVCGSEVRPSARYPWHLCGECATQVVDSDGRRLRFGNQSLSGGLQWAYADDETWHGADGGVVGLVHGRPVLVSEAHMGGIVVQPIPHPLERRTGHDLR